jgi:phosphatidylinositol-3-phosphatase
MPRYLSPDTGSRRTFVRALFRFAALIALLGATTAAIASKNAASNPPPVRHVFVIMLENEAYTITFGQNSLAPYLAHDLPAKGALLPNYYGIGHYSLDNYIAMISGQAPNPATQDDCTTYSEFVPSAAKADAHGQLPGNGCVYPKSVNTLADQLVANGFSWKAYMEDMGNDPSREPATCGHVAIGANDPTRSATPNDQYAAKHNPFVYFHSIIDDKKYCDTHVVNLNALSNDLTHLNTTPNFVYITPNLCHDGHDAPCKNGEKGGLISANAFLQTWVPRILNSPAYKKDGLLIITFDEGTAGDACCGEQPLPGGPQPGQFGPGGGQIGAVLLSPFIKPGTTSTVAYNHYSFLRTLEDIFGLKHLGYAADAALKPFGHDVFTAHPAAQK